jgi:UDP-N-acetylglucosamine 2-epimerase (non-hydrolysing)
VTEMKICTVFGTRPEAIKLAPVIRCLEVQPGVEQRIVVTGQHRELLDQALDLFSIRPEVDLRVMTPKQDLGTLTARILAQLANDFLKHRPDWVVVQGDTTTALTAALAAFYQRIPVAHVEAGLRTNDRYNPYPEEINRRFVDQLASLHFAPTEKARENLLKESLDAGTIHVTGNTGIDALLEIAGRTPHANASAEGSGNRLILVTAHRRESFGLELLNICGALRELVKRNPELHILYVIHPNPNVRVPVQRALAGVPRIETVAALDYLSFVQLMKRSWLILTDSGGIQEEAPSLGKPVLVMRDRTERVEAIEAGTARLVGTDPAQIVGQTEKILHDFVQYSQMAQARNPYGDGHAAARIVELLVRNRCTLRAATPSASEWPHSATVQSIWR